MRDRDEFTRTHSPPLRDPERDRPFREVFARRLPGRVRQELEKRVRAAYDAALESTDTTMAFPDASDLRGVLVAAVVDLRETVALLASVADEYAESLNAPEMVLSMLAGPRRLEVEAVAERLEELLSWHPTTARPFPPDLVQAVLVPRAYRDAPLA